MSKKQKTAKEITLSQEESLQVKQEAIGGSGVAISAGYYDEEYLGELKHSNDAYEVYDKMRRQDYQIKAVIRAITTPIQAAKYSYSTKDAKDEAQIRQANFKNDVLMRFMCKTFNETLNEILSFLIFGFAVFEPTFYVKDTKEYGQVIVLRDLGFRKQSTIEQWELDSNGDIERVRQHVSSGDHIRDIWLSGDEIIVFSNEKEGSNYEGISILRAAYGPYFRKAKFLKLDLIGSEKMAVGTPIAYIDQALYNDDKELSRLKAVLERYSAHEKQFIILPDGMKDGGFDIKKGEYSSASIDNSIKREDLAILNSVLASFLAIGTLSAGGNAQNDGQMQLFLNSLNHIAQYVCQKLDPIIHQTYVMNFGEPEVKLEMRCSGISKKNLKENADVVATLTKAGLLTPDSTLEAHIRDKNDLPMKEGMEEDAADEGQEGQEEDEEPQEEIANSDKGDMFSLNERDMTDAEKLIDFQEIEKDFDSAEDKYEKVVRRFVKKMNAKYLADVKTALNNSNREKSVMSIKVGFGGQLETELKELFKSYVETGEKQASNELKEDTNLQDDGVVKKIVTRILFRANEVVEDVTTRLKRRGANAALNSIADGADDEKILEDVETELNEYESSKVPIAGKGATVNQFINIGRNNFFFRNTALVQGFQFSAILDDKTTHICRSLDGQTFSPDDVSSFDLRPPLHWECRSVLIPIRKTAPAVNLTGLKVKSVGGLSAKEILKQKQFQEPLDSKSCDHINLHQAPVGTVVERDGKEYVKDYDGKFRLK